MRVVAPPSPPSVSFTFLITFVFLNLFIGVILDGFDSAKEESEDFITEEDFTRFAEHWSNFDPHATCLMSVQVGCRFFAVPGAGILLLLLCVCSRCGGGGLVT